MIAPPTVTVVTDRMQSAAAGRAVVATVAAALAGGADGVLLRERDLDPADRRALAEDLRALTRAAGAALVVAGDAGLAQAVEADGVHLAAADPWPPPAPGGAGGGAVGAATGAVGAGPGRGATVGSAGAGGGGAAVAGLAVGRSCHTVAELAAAAAAGAAWVTYSPVYVTASKPGYGPALGPDGLAAGCRAVPGSAVVALGGIGPGRAAACLAAGAAGVALMGAVMGAAAPDAVVAAVVAELRAAAR